LKRIGLFGGTFNPIHLGHLRAALEIKEAFSLDKNYIIPSSMPPHKNTAGLVEAADRLAMIQLVVSNHPDFAVSDIELKRPGPSYTVDTVNYFKSTLPKDTRLYLIVGLDAFLEIDTWKSYMDLFQIIPLIVMARPDTKWKNADRRWQILDEFLKSHISDGYVFSTSRSSYVHNKKQPIFVYNVTLLDISSSIIRKLIKQGHSIKFLVPEKVENYIKTKGLYL
jgi:nicotinate-nucleotide adenylyltransferase